MRVRIGNIYVISPIGLGNKRWSRIHPKLLARCPGVPIERVSINKNHLDFSGSRHLMHEDRSLWTRLLIRMGWVKNVIPFSQYDPYFHERSKLRIKGRLLYSGEIACSLAHLLAWQKISLMDAPGEAALVIEDDAVLTDALQDLIDLPEPCDLLHLAPELIHNYTAAGKGFLRLLPWEHTEMVYEKMNWITLGYVLSPEGARNLLNADILSSRHPIDATLLNQAFTPPLHIFATQRPWLKHPGLGPHAKSDSLIYSPLGRRIVENVTSMLPNLLALWHMFPRRLRMLVKQYLYHRG